MAYVLLILLALISFSLLPAWKLWQASALLRLIPASMMLIGFGVFILKRKMDMAFRAPARGGV
jgi:hypothetical protein